MERGMDEIAFERQKRHAARVFVVAVAGMLIIAAVIAYVVLQNRPETETPFEAAVPGLLTPAATAAGGPGQIAPLRIEIHATGRCWVSATVDGRQVLARTLQAGERATLVVNESAVFDVDDAGAFGFTIDGRPGRPLGRTGETTTARITRETVASYLR
jgi:hypothetical protein